MSEVQPRRYAFDPTGTTLLVVSSDGNCRVFDVGTGRLQVEFAAHLDGAATAQACTCFCWASTVQKKTSLTSGSNRQLLVVGSSAGQLAAYDTALGESVWQLSECHEGKVTGLALADPANSSQILYSVGVDGMVCCIDAATGQCKRKFKAGKQPLTSVQVGPGGERLLVGSSGLAVWDAATEQRIYKYPGHTMPVDALAFAGQGQYAVSSSQGERHVAVWKAAGKASKKAKPAAALLSMTEPAVQLDTATSSSGSSSFDVLAISASGRVCVWRCDVGETVTATLRATVEGSAADATAPNQEEAVLTASFQPGASEEIIIARGSSAKPTVERVQLTPIGATPQSIVLQAHQAGGLLLKQQQQHKQKGAAGAEAGRPPAAVGPDNAGDAVMLKPQLAADIAAKQSRKRQAEGNTPEAELAQHAAGQPEAMQLDTRESEGDEELTLEQRVNALQIQQQPSSQVEASNLSTKAGSVVVLVSQALRSADNQLLEKCFSMSNEKVVKATVQQLAPQDAARLLQVAVQRLQSSPARGKQIAVWLRAVLMHHTAYLITAPGVQSNLAGLYQSIEARLALYKPLVSLQGRLDLLLAQTPPVDPLTSHLAAGPLIYHDESDDPGEEVEDVMALQADAELPSDSDEGNMSDLEDTSNLFYEDSDED